MSKVISMIALVIALGLLAWGFYQDKNTLEEPPIPGGPVTVIGVSECLPHRDTSGPQTLECALGLAALDGKTHYALDLQFLPATSSPLIYPTGTRLEVSGTLTPVQALSTIHWQKYNIVGIISATSTKEY